MSNTIHAQHNQHNILRASARADQDSLEDSPQHESLGGDVATGDRPRQSSMDAIRHHAYGKWETAGKPAGDGTAFWLEAEREIAIRDRDNWARGSSQDADRHSEIRHPHSLKL
jgi:hypothetical protein